jgi:hypothetical protein
VIEPTSYSISATASLAGLSVDPVTGNVDQFWYPRAEGILSATHRIGVQNAKCSVSSGNPSVACTYHVTHAGQLSEGVIVPPNVVVGEVSITPVFTGPYPPLSFTGLCMCRDAPQYSPLAQGMISPKALSPTRTFIRVDGIAVTDMLAGSSVTIYGSTVYVPIIEGPGMYGTTISASALHTVSGGVMELLSTVTSRCCNNGPMCFLSSRGFLSLQFIRTHL